MIKQIIDLKIDNKKLNEEVKKSREEILICRYKK